MNLPLKSILLSGAILGLVSWGASKAPEAQLVAMTSGLQSMTDTDGDGLDDVLEVLLGSSITDANTDNDSLSDLEEHLMGSDPLVYDSVGQLSQIQRELKLDVYSNGADVVIQVSGLYSQGITGFRLYAANENSSVRIPLRLLAAFQSDVRQFSTNLAGFQAVVYRFKLPAQLFHRSSAMAIGVTANVDNMGLGVQSHLLSVSGKLLEYRDFPSFGVQGLSSGGGASGGASGGLFPTSPGDQMPGEISLGQICVQSLQEIASLGGSQKLYQVTDSYCDFMPRAACFSSCSSAIGGSVVGIDIVGLLGG